MRVGVDTSVIVACVHARHPLHPVMAQWLNQAFDTHDVIVSHHSVLESYAVLTRLPAEYRLVPAEAVTVLRETLTGSATIAPFSHKSMWDVLERIHRLPAVGGSAYDAFIIDTLTAAGVDAIATGNAKEFRRLTRSIRIIDPCRPEA